MATYDPVTVAMAALAIGLVLALLPGTPILLYVLTRREEQKKRGQGTVDRSHVRTQAAAQDGERGA